MALRQNPYSGYRSQLAIPGESELAALARKGRKAFSVPAEFDRHSTFQRSRWLGSGACRGLH
jgi:hypothetical protein